MTDQVRWGTPPSRSGASVPFVRVCSYCSRVHVPSPGSAGVWIACAVFDWLSTDITLSHGICPSCVSAVTEPTLDGTAVARG